jgi:tol-pal system protein YbgF
VNAFERDLRDLTGRTEELQNQLRNLNNTLSDLGTRMTALEARVGTAAISPLDTLPSVPVSDPSAAAVSSDPASPVSIAPSLPVPVTPNAPAPSNSPTVEPLGNLSMSSETGQAVVPASDPTLAYENAMTMLKQKNYTGAEKTFSDFLTAFKDHQLAPNARYWLGETYFAQQKYDQSARVFAEGYQQAPKGSKAADNLLKLGLSLAATGNTTDACIALGQISKDFPSGASAVRSRAVSEMKRMKCPGA